MWNETNDQTYWAGGNSSLGDLETQLYDMVKPAVVNIIRANVSGAQILTPSVSACAPSSTCTAFQTWQQEWLNLEDTKTRISNIYNFHVYLHDYPQTETVTPEERWSTVEQMLTARNGDSHWTNTPWWNDETNFNGTDETCNSSFSPQDCSGQIARWQLLHASNSGANLSTNLSWYKWEGTIGQNSQYAEAYKYIMEYMVGGVFSQPCSHNNLAPPTWTCPFTERNGPTPALFVWAPSGNVSYNASGWVDYRDLMGVATQIDPTDPYITIGVEPFMLEGRPTNQ
jgi:hypothetical protein